MAASASLASSSALKTARIVGRAHECNLIREALEASDGRTRIFYFVASAGVGKTRLLQEAGRIANEPESKACFIGLFDFFETELHSNSALEKRIVQSAKDNLNLDDDAFPRYHAARQAYEKLKRELTTIKDANEKRVAIGQALIDDLNEISRARGCKLVFCFDTLEALQNESDNVQEIIDEFVRLQVIESRAWLAKHLPLLENAVVVMAGRTKPGLKEYLEESFSASKLAYHSPQDGLGNLGEADVAEFFQAMADRYNELAQDFQNAGEAKSKQTAQKFAETFAWYKSSAHNIWVLTEGWPLMLGFVCDLILHRRDLPDEFLPNAERVEANAPSIDAIQKRVQNKLYDGARSAIDTEAHDALPYISLLRKGATAKLLALAAKKQEWSEEQCCATLENLEDVSYAKPKIMNGELVMFLHDQLYDIMDAKNPIGPNSNEYKSILDTVIGNYDSAIQTANKEWQSAQDDAERRQARDLEFRLTAEQLYYKMLLNPMNGYHAYGAIFDRAILNRQLGLDMLVRDEMLRFFGPRLLSAENRDKFFQDENEILNGDRIERGAAIRWVERLIASGNYEAAIRAARAFKTQPELSEQYDPLFISILDMWEGEAAAYLGKPDFAEPLALLNSAIKRFENKKTRAALNTRHLRLLNDRNLGRAYNNLAYVYGRLYEWERAVNYYNPAIRLLRDAGQPHQHANALKNQANAYANLGEYSAALSLVQEAERICVENDFGYLRGLCINTRALIDIMREQPYPARAFAHEAHDLLLQLLEGGETRGIGLASTVRGRACRRMIKLSLYGKREDAINLFEEGKTALEEALQIFINTDEKSREHEARNELGSLYRDWAAVARKQKGDKQQIEDWERQAETLLNEALQLARSLSNVNDQADTLNDIAELRFNQSESEQALVLLGQADDVIKKNYPNYPLLNKLPLPSKPRTSLFTLLGINALLRGHIQLRKAIDENKLIVNQKALNGAMRDYLLASAYYDRFGGDKEAQGLNAARTQAIFNRLLGSGLKTPDLEKLSKFVHKTQAAWHAKYPKFPKQTTFGSNFDKIFGIIK